MPSFSSSAQARRIDQALVARFTESNPPTVWRMDLEKNHSFAVAIQGRDGDWQLGVVSPKGEFTTVARFESRDDVDAAFKVVHQAMMQKPGRVLAPVMRVTLSAFMIVAALVLGLYAMTVITINIPENLQTALRQQGSAQQAAPGQIVPGVPVSADEMLRNR